MAQKQQRFEFAKSMIQIWSDLIWEIWFNMMSIIIPKCSTKCIMSDNTKGEIEK